MTTIITQTTVAYLVLVFLSQCNTSNTELWS